jgi:hypothetical protein
MTTTIGSHHPGGKGSRRAEETLPAPFLVLAAALFLLGWGLAALRHTLLRSNAFDLGIYDQVAWQFAWGLEPRSTLLELHHMGNHGAWAFAAMGLLYRIHPSVQWLLMLQSLALAFTAIPLWRLAALRGLTVRLRWFVAVAWWLQAPVLNTNLYDFHPETLAMPLLAQLFVLEARNRWAWWVLTLLLLLGFRDGLTPGGAGHRPGGACDRSHLPLAAPHPPTRDPDAEEPLPAGGHGGHRSPRSPPAPARLGEQ